jgi:hypothetical protein
MPYAVCIQCGEGKRRPYSKCHRCGFLPLGDDVAMAKSIILSTERKFSRGETPISKTKLMNIGRQIRSGQEYNFDETQIQRLIVQKKELERPWTAKEKLRTILFFLGLAIIPIAWLIYWLIKWLL